MKPTEFWRWDVWSQTGPRKRIKTRHHMTEMEALARDPTAKRVPGSREVRLLPECEEEALRNTHSGRAREERAACELRVRQPDTGGQ
jgi:hypothetical protein